MDSKNLPRGIDVRHGWLRYRKVINGIRHEKTTTLKPTASDIKFAITDFKDWVTSITYGIEDEIDERDQVQEPKTFRDVAELYLLAKKKGKLKFSTLKGYQEICNFWSDRLPGHISAITSKKLIAIDERIEWQNERTRHNKLTPLKGVFKYALLKGFIENNPTGVLQDGKYEITEPDPYTQDEVDRLMAELDQTHYSLFFRIAFGSGMRTGELIALTWDKFDGESLYVNDSIVLRKQTDSTKTRKPRRVLLGDDEIQLLNSAPRPIQGGPIFTSHHTHKPMTTGKPPLEAWKDAHRSSGVRKRDGLYPWRHTYISSMLSHGVDPQLVANQVGDNIATILDYYYRYIPRQNDHEIVRNALSQIRENGAKMGQKSDFKN